MKLHRPLVYAVANGLLEIFRDGKYADKAIERILRSNPRWGSHDRAFIAENTYDIVRWWRRYWTILAYDSAGIRQFDAWMQTQDLTEKKMLRLLATHLVLNRVELPQWDGFTDLHPKEIFENNERCMKERAIAASIPDWLDELGAVELGEDWDAELAALNTTAKVVLRVNTLKTNMKGLQFALQDAGWNSETTPISPDALVLKKRGNIFQLDHFKRGFFEVQDAASQCIGNFMKVEPGMRVIDACAGAGGKSLHLAALMENKGQIIALDTEEHRLAQLRKRARRNGAHIIEARVIESSKTIKRLHGTADRVLLDVPCSGLGVLRRNPDAKWKLSLQQLDSVRIAQADILERYSKMIKPDGQLVYATCSILPSENELQVQKFLEANPDFTLLEEKKLSPAKDGFDGFYMARLAKKEEAVLPPDPASE